MSIAFVFVCQAGQLESMAVLLAASIREQQRFELELIAAVPPAPHTHILPSNDTYDALRELGCRIVRISNPMPESYPIGHKIACLGVPTDAARLCFLDSDILMLRPFDEDELPTGAICSGPAPRGKCLRLNEWQSLYADFGVEIPPGGPDYYSSGVVMIDKELAADFAERWSSVANRYFARPRLPDKYRSHIDQITMPVAAALLPQRITPLVPKWNYVQHLHPTLEGDPIFYHYQAPWHLHRFAESSWLALKILRNRTLASIVKRDPHFASNFRARTPVVAPLRRVKRRLSTRLALGSG